MSKPIWFYYLPRPLTWLGAFATVWWAWALMADIVAAAIIAIFWVGMVAAIIHDRRVDVLHALGRLPEPRPSWLERRREQRHRDALEGKRGVVEQAFAEARDEGNQPRKHPWPLEEQWLEAEVMRTGGFEQGSILEYDHAIRKIDRALWEALPESRKVTEAQQSHSTGVIRPRRPAAVPTTPQDPIDDLAYRLERINAHQQQVIEKSRTIEAGPIIGSNIRTVEPTVIHVAELLRESAERRRRIER